MSTNLKPGEPEMEIPDKMRRSDGRRMRMSHVHQHRLPRASILFALALPCTVLIAGAQKITLPIEVVGEDGTTSGVTVDVSAGRAPDVRSLWMQVHGLAYGDMVSIQVNSSTWLPLNNKTVEIAEPGKSYGGIGGGFSTLKLNLPLPAGAIVEGANILRFRFNHTDGISSGFRVLAFNLVTSDSRRLLSTDLFVEDDPAAWQPPLRDAASIRAGQDAWENATLVAGGLKDSPRIRAHCADCHAYDGRDLKYFNFSNASIIARSRFHGLSDLQGRQIASYIRALPVPNPGRPWNPPYQPGPGLDQQAVANWSAGAGIGWVLDSDLATLPFLFGPGGGRAPRPDPQSAGKEPDWSAVVPLITREAFRPDSNLNPREIPISLQLPDWSHWLPQVHPLDAWGPSFQNSEFAQWYGSNGGSGYAGKEGSAESKSSFRSLLASPQELPALISSGRIVTYFDKWRDSRRAFLKQYTERGSVNWTPELGVKTYSTELWQLVKTWEITQEFGLEGRGRELYGPTGESRTWLNVIPAATAPAAANIPDGPAGMGGSALTNEYFDASWYELQIILNSGNHRHRDRTPVDWLYVIGRFLDLQRETHRPEPARLLIAVIKALQSTDPRLGPENHSQGWRPTQTVDPTIMVSKVWAATFQLIPADAKRAITESFLAAWLDKNMQYPTGRYFTVGSVEDNYAAPDSFGGISGGRVWDSAPLFQASGVSQETISRLQKWGTAFTEVAARFQYTSGPAGSRGAPGRKSGAK